MANIQLRNQITADVRVLRSGDLAEGAMKLFATLGYESTRYGPESDVDSPQSFLENLHAKRTDTQSEKEFLQEVSSVRLLFQVTDSEIQTASSQTADMFGGSEGETDTNITQSFLFAVAQLKGKSYSRGVYARIAREINKKPPIATVVLMRTASGNVSLAFVDRRPHKRRPGRAVLGNVALLREIETEEPHRAHLDILSELALGDRLEWMSNAGKSIDFVGLLAAWLDVLNTEELNKRFYRGLFKWFNRVIDEAKFPAGEAKQQAPEEHVIRLISRMLFVWFIRENGLVPDELFSEQSVRDIITDYDTKTGDSYYRVILQNLFFATLNSPIKDRGFRDPFGRNGRANDHHRVFNKYRYEDEVVPERKDELLALFKRTPFINGGLFDCLDSEAPTSAGGYRIDCFSDWHIHKAKLSIPNRLFFDESGLYQLFRSFKFTVEENTPAEREVALDPELLGNVFENLLAAFNPETSKDARKLTGSFYTPRPVVEYMVDHALVEALLRMCRIADDDQEWWSDRLHYLFDYNDAGVLFEDEEKERLVAAISDIKVLDPAVGSGAYPMAVLLKLTQALRRIDPDSKLWLDRQFRLAGEKIDANPRVGSSPERQIAQQEVIDAVDTWRTKDYGRKLYILQNSIFGVDQQAAAIQIAKLRFFISLAIEQEVDQLAENYGVRPLPNLETRLIAANSVRKLPEGIQTNLQTARRNGVAEIERELTINRNRQFHARLYEEKRECAQRDRDLRQRLSTELRSVGLDKQSAAMLALWDPFDQTSSANWFEPEHMFGVKDGFDVVIGNPPYVNVENIDEELRGYLFSEYRWCTNRTNIYIAFIERSYQLAGGVGTVMFILPDSFMDAPYAQAARRCLASESRMIRLVDASSYRIFENASVFNIVLMFGHKKAAERLDVRIYESNDDFVSRSPNSHFLDFQTIMNEVNSQINASSTSDIEELIRTKIESQSFRLDQICWVALGAKLHNPVNKVGKAHYISAEYLPNLVPFIEGRDIKRFEHIQSAWLNYSPDEHLESKSAEYFASRKLMLARIVGPRPRVSLDEEGLYNSHTVINAIHRDSLAGIDLPAAVKALNSLDEDRCGEFDIWYLLGVLNSSAVAWYCNRYLRQGSSVNPNAVKALPIPVGEDSTRQLISDLAVHVWTSKREDPFAATDHPELEIDRLVQELYDLTPAEVVVIASAVTNA